MKKLILIVSFVLSACGGSNDWESPEGDLCRTALAQYDVNENTMPPHSESLYHYAGYDIFDFNNGYDIGDKDDLGNDLHISYGSCKIVNGVVTSVTLQDGTTYQ